MGEKKKKQKRGLGDSIAEITRRVGIQPCDACKKRQKKLNDWFPYEGKKGKKP